MQNHSYRKQWKSLYEITHQRSLLASAQRLGGNGLQGLSVSPLSFISVIINWSKVISCGSYMTGEQRHDCREFVWTLFKTKDEWDGSSKWWPLFTILFKTFVWTSRRPKKNGAGPVLFKSLLKSSRLCPKDEQTTLLENLSKTKHKVIFHSEMLLMKFCPMWTTSTTLTYTSNAKEKLRATKTDVTHVRSRGFSSIIS